MERNVDDALRAATHSTMREDAQVTERQEQSVWGAPLVVLEFKMTNQDGQPLASGRVDVELLR